MRAHRTSVGTLLALCLAASGCRKENPAPAADPHAGHGASASGPAASAVSAHQEGSEHAGHGQVPADPMATEMAHDAPAGYASFPLDRASASAVGLRLAPILERKFSKQVRTSGVVVLDETRTSHVHAKVRGFIERIDVDFVGKSVRAGAPLCSIYSQEVLAAELEFLSVLEQASSGPGLSGSLAAAEQQAKQQLIAAAKNRLALWDVPSTEIDRLEKTRLPQRTFTLNAPRAGIVVAKQALAGMFVDPSVELYLISDTSKLWLLADLYESDAAGVQVGDSAQLSIEGANGEAIPARIAFLPPTLEESTRTLKARFDLDNVGGRLRPGAFATVELTVDRGTALAVPEEAVIHAGQQAIAFVVAGEQIVPRSVKLGPLVDGFYVAEEGLHAGESVAVGAQFLLDSESRLRATSGRGASHGGH